MKKMSQLAVTAAILLAPFMVAAPALAQTENDITNTGPDSGNKIEEEHQYTCKVNNENNVTITNTTTQDAFSGEVSVTDNTDGGGAKSGTVTNSNNTTFNVTIINDETCEVAVAPTPETPEQPEEPEQPTPGRGEAPTPVQPSQNVTPTALPVTSGDTAPVIVLAASVLAMAGLAIAYRRLF